MGRKGKKGERWHGRWRREQEEGRGEVRGGDGGRVGETVSKEKKGREEVEKRRWRESRQGDRGAEGGGEEEESGLGGEKGRRKTG